MKQVLVTVFLLCIFAVAADAPKFSEISKLKLVNAYQKAIIAQVNFQNAQKQAQDAVASFNALCEAETKTAGLAQGTQCQVNMDTQEVTAVAPKAEEKK